MRRTESRREFPAKIHLKVVSKKSVCLSERIEISAKKPGFTPLVTSQVNGLQENSVCVAGRLNSVPEHREPDGAGGAVSGTTA